MKDIETAVKNAERNLNNALEEYKLPSAPLAIEFRELKLQAMMFQYEICAEMNGFIRNAPIGFASVVALKGLVHRLYEYDRALNSHILKRLLELAQARNIDIDRKAIAEERKKWRGELKKLSSWSSLRNKVTGHYDADLAAQVHHLEQLHLSDVMSVTQGFLSFNIAVLKVLKDAGRGSGT